MAISAPRTRPPVSAEQHRLDLVTTLVEQGVLGGVWYPAFRAVARHRLLRRFDDTHPWGSQRHNLQDRDHGRREAALRAAYADMQLCAQIPRGTKVSSTQPSLAARVLEALFSTVDGRRALIGNAPAAAEPVDEPLVLELGTGSGYLTALLEEHLGAGAVTTVEIDAITAEAARQNLARLGYRPRVHVADALSFTSSSLFTRLLCGFTVDHVPGRWLAAMRPGGVMVFPLGQCVLRLEVDESGGACGRTIAVATPWWSQEEPVDREIAAYEVFARCREDGGPRPLSSAAIRHPAARAWLSVVEPSLRQIPLQSTVYDAGDLAYVDTASGAMLYLAPDETDGMLVWEDGHRGLGGRVEAATARWVEAGCPDPLRLGITADAAGSYRAWVDAPERVVAEIELPTTLLAVGAVS